MTNNEIISVVIPVYNREQLIGKTIKSILEQTYNNFEILIIDDNSTDGTKEAITKINDSRIRYFKQEYNQGPSAARNRGINVSKGNYIAFLDSDDLWDTNKLSDQFKIFDQYKDEYDVVFSGFRILDLKTGLKIKESIISESICDNFKNGKFFLTPSPCTLLIRKRALLDVGGFDERLKANEDTELAIKLCKKGYKFYNQKYSLVTVFRNHDSLMSNKKNYIDARKIIIEKHQEYLSKTINFNLCKQVANYVILNNELDLAKVYLLKAIKINPVSISTIVLYIILIISPNLIRFLYSTKYKEIPNTSGINIT